MVLTAGFISFTSSGAVLQRCLDNGHTAESNRYSVRGRNRFGKEASLGASCAVCKVCVFTSVCVSVCVSQHSEILLKNACIAPRFGYNSTKLATGERGTSHDHNLDEMISPNIEKTTP